MTSAAASTAGRGCGDRHPRVGDRWRAFMRFQIERNRQLYAEAAPGIAWLDPAGRFAIAAAAGLYRDILEIIAARDGDVFSQRARPRTGTALPRAIGLWMRSQRPPVHERAAAAPAGGALAVDLGATERG